MYKMISSGKLYKTNQFIIFFDSHWYDEEEWVEKDTILLYLGISKLTPISKHEIYLFLYPKTMSIICRMTQDFNEFWLDEIKC